MTTEILPTAHLSEAEAPPLEVVQSGAPPSVDGALRMKASLKKECKRLRCA
jgi:hypothetical protein